ncbi:MAG: hypothetical protein EOR67_28055 [Mesorhizobium sp.]|uniref:preATP grasp domain-containing protein n=1 Tax=Mesorhizobium sp. TaxID=1871066 RepID=UPI000FE5FEF4|nr:peptide ligase PGM1-related protein [Mesorhizobium sp.]RWL81957.1 MAG: hypothetical protein EOR67_28055 [Mesorhizobium sp.]
MTGIILGNINSGAMAPPPRALSDSFLQTNAAAAKRMIWLATHDDVLITPTVATKPFLDYVNALKGGSTIISIATSPSDCRRPLPISEDDLRAGGYLMKSLSSLVSRATLSHLEPHIVDHAALEFAQELGLPVTFANRRAHISPEITGLFNHKGRFREFAPKLGVPIANGETCVTTQALVEAAQRALSCSNAVILKMARHSGGEGNAVITKTVKPSFQGAMHTVAIEKIDADSLCETVLRLGLHATEREPVIIEVYNENEASIGVHFDVQPDHVELVGAASILFNPGYGGACWSKTVADGLPMQVLSWCRRLADYAWETGYLGPISVDIVKGKRTGFFACEVNGRHGGFTTTKSVVKSLGVEDDVKAGERVALSRTSICLEETFSDLISRLERKHLHFRRADRRGVVVVTEGYRNCGPYDFLLLANDQDDLGRMEQQLIRLFRGS